MLSTEYFYPNLGLDWISDSRGTAMISAIKNNQTPESISEWLTNSAAVVTAIKQYSLLFIALEHANLPFVRYFASIVPHQALTPTHLFTLAIDNHYSRTVLEELVLSVPATYFTVDLLAKCLEVANVAALNSVYKFVTQPLSPDDVQRLLSIACTATGECMEWLSAQNLIIYDQLTWALVYVAYTSQSDSLIDWLREKGLALVCSSNDDMILHYIEVLLEYDVLHQLLIDNTVEELYCLAPRQCVLAVLESGNLVWCRQLPAALFCGASNLLAFYVYKRAVESGNPGVLDYLAERIPLSPEIINDVVDCLSVCLPVDIFVWFVRHAPIPQITLFVEEFAVKAAVHSAIEHLNFFAKLETNPLFWYQLSSRVRFNSLDVVDWFAAQCRYWPKMFAKIPDYRKILSLMANKSVHELMRVFDRAPASICTSLPPEMAKITRLWWQYQRAKIGVLIMAVRRLRARSLPPELWHFLAAEHLSGL
jgi:hypothetical protein